MASQSIYGYTVPGGPDDTRNNLLRKHNLKYGGDSEGCRLITCESQKPVSSSMGCCIKNLHSGEISGSPVISWKNYIAVFDAVLYNRAELESSLSEENNNTGNFSGKFSEMTDGELLFFYILKHGFRNLKNVNGDFSGAIYDKGNRTWTLIRDHCGIRPLFFYLDHESFIFSTDIRGIIGFPGIRLSLNEKYFYDLMMGYNELTLCRTDYEEINCIRPGSWTVIGPDFKISENEYWRPAKGKVRFSDRQQYAKKLRELITDSVRRRLDAVSGAVGCELSGGLDSSVIAILISRLGREALYYSWSESPADRPLKDGEDERKVIADICNRENIKCTFVEKIKAGEGKSLKELLQSKDVPYINTRFISKGCLFVRENGAGVMFSGHGGDEGVSHRGNFYELWYQKEFLSFFRAIWNSTKGKGKRILRLGYRVLDQFFRIQPHLKKEYRNFRNMEAFLTDSFREKMKGSKHLPLTFSYDPAAYILQGGPRVRIDNAAVQGAECGVQYIFPYLDYRILDYALSIPRYCFQNGFSNRAVFREAFDDLMPESLRQVRYKDEASLRDFVPGKELMEKVAERQREILRDLLTYINKDKWEAYLDFRKIKSLESDILPDEGHLDRTARIIDALVRCALIQNLSEEL